MISWINGKLSNEREKIVRLGQTNRLVRLILTLGWLHEACHILAAKLVGLKVYSVSQIEIYVDDTGSPGQMLVVLLAPAFVGIVGLALGIVGLAFTQSDSLSVLVVSMSISWLMACWLDLFDAWKILQKK